MNINLDKIDFSRADPGKMREYLSNFAHYCKDAWEIANSFAIPSYFIKCKKVVFLGMGASGIVAEFLKDLLRSSTLVVECVHDYDLPNWVDKETLVIAVSHSGDTEEDLYAFVSAYQKNAKLLAITTGGKLENLCSKYRSPIIKYSFDSEPKLAFPYLFIIPSVVLKKLGYLELSKDDFDKAYGQVLAQTTKITPENHSAVNPAKDLATKIQNTLVFVISSGNLRSSGMRFAHAINEDGKNFATFNFLPEIDHNLIAGLEFPKELLEDLTIVFVESKFSRPEIKKRENLTAHILSSKKISYLRINFPQAANRFSEILLSVNFIEHVGMYLGLLNQVDPVSAKIVDQFKIQLGQEGR